LNNGLNKTVIGKVFSDHPNGGASVLTDVKNYASQGTVKRSCKRKFKWNRI